MRVNFTPGDGFLTVEYEPGDPRFSGTVGAAGESRLLYHLKQELNSRGYDFIKKRMWKDGHLVDEWQQYLRERKPDHEAQRQLAVYNTRFNIEGAEEILNREGKVKLAVTNLYLPRQGSPA